MLNINKSTDTDSSYMLETLQKPDFLENDCSNICSLHLDTDKIIVGHEKGCYLMNIDSNPGFTELKQFHNNEVVGMCSSADDDNQFFIASQKSVYLYDIRVSLSNHQHCFSDNIDEVNKIKVNRLNHLAACDDAGEIKIYDLKTNSIFRCLRRKHTNICSTLTFIPDRSDELLTGGLDSQIFAWDYKRVKILQHINTQELLSQLGDDSVYMFNPPLVYSLEVTEDGKIVATGLGNGAIQLFKVLKGKKVLVPYLVINRHSSVGVSDVCFIKPLENDSSSMLVSGGNDGIVNLWSVVVDCTKKKKQPPIINKVCSDEETENILIASMDTHSKVNFIQDAWISNNRVVFIGDQTSSLKYFKICL